MQYEGYAIGSIVTGLWVAVLAGAIGTGAHPGVVFGIVLLGIVVWLAIMVALDR